MAYVQLNDFRSASLAEFCRGIPLTAAEADDTDLAAAIARMQLRVDDFTNDRFEAFTTTYLLDGRGRIRLVLPNRCMSVATVKTRDNVGTLTTQATTVWRLVQSLTESGTQPISSFDYLAVVPGQQLAGMNSWDWPYAWPTGPNTVEVTGSFGWPSPPSDIRRATALMVWDHFRGLDPMRRSATSWATLDTTYGPTSGSTQLQEANQILTEYRRELVPF